MDPAVIFFLLLFLLPLCLLLTRKSSERLPPGSLGLPIIGQTLSFLRALRRNTAEQWLQDRVRKYGLIWKMNLFGCPTVFLTGQAANKFIYTCDGSILANQQPLSMRRIFGQRNILELSGYEHKRVRGALLSFLKPEALKQYVGKMDEGIRKHFEIHWVGKQKILVCNAIYEDPYFRHNDLTYNGNRTRRKAKIARRAIPTMIKGFLSVPVDLPFTSFNRCVKASSKIRTIVMDLIREKRAALESQTAFPQQDLVTSLLSLRNEDNSMVLSDEEIADNALITMVGGYDTTSILLSCLIKLLANDEAVCARIVQEQEEIARSKVSGELLTWDDLARMKYTWRVAMESLRIIPPVFGSFRKVLKDFEYEGYLIPEGWQVTWAASMTHMDESIFPDPSKFDPKRFEKQAPVPPYSYVPFGGGPRICPGQEFVRFETLIAIHYLVNRFTWKLCCPEISIFRDRLPIFKDGLEIEIVPKIPVEVD